MPMLTNFIIRTKGNDKKRLIELIENNENLEGYGSKDLSNDICEIYGSCYRMINDALTNNELEEIKGLSNNLEIECFAVFEDDSIKQHYYLKNGEFIIKENLPLFIYKEYIDDLDEEITQAELDEKYRLEQWDEEVYVLKDEFAPKVLYNPRDGSLYCNFNIKRENEEEIDLARIEEDIEKFYEENEF